jgi:glycosyltransferase involved in cell wall biosynthesis
VLAPSADTASRLNNYFTDLHIEVRPHAPPFVPLRRRAMSPRAKKVRVGLIGAIGGHKGYHVLLGCARDAAKRRLPLEFVVIGYTENDERLLKTGKVFITGRYSEIEAPHLLRRERPDIVFLPSVWPETWCYTLDYAVAAALPVISFDLGAIAERLQAAGLGVLLPLGLSARQINDCLLCRIADRRNPPTYVRTSRSAERDDATM